MLRLLHALGASRSDLEMDDNDVLAGSELDLIWASATSPACWAARTAWPDTCSGTATSRSE